MIVDIIMPKMGESIMEGTILEWRKKVGDFVEKDELFLEIGTDKVDSEIPSVVSGTLVEILAAENDVIDVGNVIARIETDADDANKVKPPEGKTVGPDSKSVPEPIKEMQDPKPKRERPAGKFFFTPVVFKIARENDISLGELESIPGSGRGGRVTKKDIITYIEQRGSLPPAVAVQKVLPGPAPRSKSRESSLSPQSSAIPGKTEEMHHMRKLIAGHMRVSLDTSAHAYVMTEVDMTPIVDYVKTQDERFLAREGFKLTFTPFIADATVKTLQDFPEVNASISGTSVTYHKNINIGLAVAIKNGLMVPAMLNCEEKNFLGLCRAVNDMAVRTRNKQILPDELTGSTFTITNFGVFGVTVGTPIINQPNVGILGVGAVKKQPVVVESEQGDGIVIRSIMMISLGFDHRLVDGACGAKFIERLRHYLETMDLSQNL
tara:strand:- start:945 stop:2249 length:1305 start_codon:yes stop_codon:yes gene_type:complete